MHKPTTHPPKTATSAKVFFLSAILLQGLLTGFLGADELVIFTHKAESPRSKAFHEEHLPNLLKEVFDLGLVAKVVDVETRGAPEDVHLTPLVVYQSHRGRAIFQGRYVDTGKVLHFVRTQRAIPPTGGALTVTDAAVADLGRAQVLAPLKITPLSGNVPAGYDDETFQARARQAIHAGFEHFTKRATATLGPSDRSFYMDFHPHRTRDGRVYISTALFSQFNCIDPIFVRFEEPSGGAWDDVDKVFAKAARELEAQVLRNIESSMIGDGFRAVPSNTPRPTWAELDLQLPERTASGAATAGDVELPERWLLSTDDGAPQLLFRFPAPLERYSGEVQSLNGALHLPAPTDLNGATGFVAARTSSVTMGEDSLDEAVRGKMIFADRFPEARFDIETSSADESLAFGRMSRLVAHGTFSMMGLKVPLEVRAQVEPVVGEDGTPRLQVQARFELRLKAPFGIEGPHGPAPANDTLNFHLNTLLEPAEAQAE